MNTTNQIETLCTGCGATVTQDVEGVLRDSSGYRFCAFTEKHEHSIELPPVAIKSEKQSAHTPGNWKLKKLHHAFGDLERPEVFELFSDRSNYWIAMISTKNPADAEFIHNACNSHDDMLSALKVAQACISGIDRTGPHITFTDEERDLIDAAISKAEDFMEEARRTR